MAGILSIQYGTIVLTNGQFTNTAVISSVDTTKSVVKKLGQVIDVGSGVAELVRVSLNNQTTVQATRSGGFQTTTVGFCVKTYA